MDRPAGVVGFVQYFTHLPVLLVGAHMLGATLVWIATLAMLRSLRERPAEAAPVPPPATFTPAEPVSAAH